MLQNKDSDKYTQNRYESTKYGRENICRQTTLPVAEGHFRRLPTTWIHRSDNQLQLQRRQVQLSALTFRLQR